jgi:hypothetical protein
MPQHGWLVRHSFHILKFGVADAIDRKKRSSPTPATLVELGFLGSVFNVHLPATIDELQPTIPPGSLKNMEMVCFSLNSVSSANRQLLVTDRCRRVVSVRRRLDRPASILISPMVNLGMCTSLRAHTRVRAVPSDDQHRSLVAARPPEACSSSRLLDVFYAN